MSSILTGDRGEQRGSTDARERAVRAVKTAMERAESDGQGGSQGRAFLVVDLGATIGSLLGNRSGPSATVEQVAERARDVATDEGLAVTGEARERSTRGRDGGGRSTLRTLFLLGAVVGIGYAVRRRMGSMDEITEQATERAREMADETAMRTGEAAGRTESATGEAAERIEETGEMAAEQVESGSEQVADRVREGGEGAADQMESAGETVEEAEREAEERAEEMSDDENENEDENEE